MYKSISISGLLTMELHSLNNEGSEGNTMMTRMVDVVVAGPDGTPGKYTVNAVSGDMFKHILVEHLTGEAKTMDLALSEGCKIGNPNRIQYDWQDNPNKYTKESRDSAILSDALAACTVTDCAGTLITSDLGKSRSIARKSCIEFGWVVGKPGLVTTDSYFHAKYVAEGRGEGKGDSANLGQNIFHRPASSGQYAAVVNVDLYTVGRNDITTEQVHTEEQRKQRCEALLKAVLATFVKPTGAHRNTQTPHIVDFSGVIATSASTVPAPCVSALNPAFESQVEEIAGALNSMNDPAPIRTFRFSDLGSFATQMAEIIRAMR